MPVLEAAAGLALVVIPSLFRVHAAVDRLFETKVIVARGTTE
jgi:hypothetical protein